MSDEIGKAEGVVIKKRLNGVLANFDNLNRHQLHAVLLKIAKFAKPNKRKDNV